MGWSHRTSGMSPAHQSQRQVPRLCSTGPVHSQGRWRPRWVFRVEEKIWGVVTATASLTVRVCQSGIASESKTFLQISSGACHTAFGNVECAPVNLQSLLRQMALSSIVQCLSSIVQCSPCTPALCATDPSAASEPEWAQHPPCGEHQE